VESQVYPQEVVNERHVDVDARDGLEAVSKNASSRDVCAARRSRGIVWPDTLVGSVARKPCPEMGEATWLCVFDRESQLPAWKNNWPNLAGKLLAPKFKFCAILK
jgi:hypothetical protein